MGAFASVPAVRHKEILWALSEGIPVIGAASIGALRAAELTAFGNGWPRLNLPLVSRHPIRRR